MEPKIHTYAQKNLVNVAGGQIKLPVRFDLQTLAKQILSVTATCLLGAAQKVENGFLVSGKVVTRAIFIDENGGYNSEEHTDDFSEKYASKGADKFASVVPSAQVIQTSADRHAKNENDLITAISAEHVLNVALTGLENTDVSYVTEIGGIETKQNTAKVSTFGASFFEKFDIGESITLENGIEGVLGVELMPNIRDISAGAGKVVVKGTAVVCVSAVKGGADGKQQISTSNYDFDFTKTFNKKDICEKDIICGSVNLGDIAYKIETREKPELVVEATLAFCGHSITTLEIKTIDDAFSCTHNVDYAYGDITNTTASGQVAANVDIDGTVTLNDKSPYIGRVLWSSFPNVSAVNVKPQEDRVTIEGVLSTNIVYECEEHNVYTHTAQVPFSAQIKIDGCSPASNVCVSVIPTSCGVKARRGKEFLVDARLGVGAMACTINQSTLMTNAVRGAEKNLETGVIGIHTCAAADTVWDIAKTASIGCADIIKQNPALENGITAGEKIVIYRRQASSF
jgi:hypothetical protein